MRKKLIPLIIICVCVLLLSTSSMRVSATATCNADLNHDLNVDLGDYSILSSDLLNSMPLNSGADLNNDGVVDLADYSILATSFFAECNPVPPVADVVLYVAVNGSDSNPGTQAQPLRTIQAAVNLGKTQQGKSVNIQVEPGTYRENVDIAGVKSPSSLTIAAQNGSGSVFINGSESSRDSRITWTKASDNLPFPSGVAGHIYSADISSFGGVPDLIYSTNNAYTSTQRLSQAQEPDFDIYQPAFNSDPRWIADGRNVSTANTLVDAHNDPSPIATGNLTNINGFTNSFLTGGRVIARDTYSGHDDRMAVITAHDSTNGMLTLDRDLTYFDGNPLVGNNSKYYVQGKPQLVDTPGEWYYDPSSKKLYIWPMGDVSPATQLLEIAVRNNGIKIHNSNNITIKDITVQFTNYVFGTNYGSDGAVYMVNSDSESSSNITLDGVNIRYSGIGWRVQQSTNSHNLTSKITLKNSKISYIEGFAVTIFQWPYKDVNGGYVPGVKNITIENNDIGYGSYRPANHMMWIIQIQNLILKNNYIHNSAHNAIEIQGGSETNALVQNNLFADNCLNGTDCGGFKIWADKTTVRNVLVTGNISMNTVGCSYASKATGKYNSSKGIGCAGFGYYADVVKSYQPGELGLIFYKNISMNNYLAGFHTTRSQEIGIFNNITINESAGVSFTTGSGSTEKNHLTQVQNNLFANDALNSTTYKNYGVDAPMNTEDRSNVTINNNIYYMPGSSNFDLGTRPLSTYTMQDLKTVSDIKATTPWEQSGVDVSAFNTNLIFQKGLQLPTTNTPYDQKAGQVPPEVQQMVSRLQTSLGIGITMDNWIGIRN